MKKLRVLVLMHQDLVPPEDAESYPEDRIPPWKTEYDILWALETLGHETLPVGVHDDLGVIRRAVERFDPHIVFNVLEEFHGATAYGQAVVTYVELMRRAYTGCNPRGLILAHDKVLTKKILAYHGIRTPRFAVLPRGTTIRPPEDLSYPLFVKSAFEDASLGISQKSIVQTPDRLVERVRFMHETFGTEALVEEYIEGREMYLGLLGNTRLQAFPVWEMSFDKYPEGKPRIATEKVKWSYRYQLKHGIQTAAADLPESKKRSIARLGKEIYRALGLSGYARLDLRMDAAGDVWLIEANANPDLAHDEDFSKSAEAAGYTYEDLIQKILRLGLSHRPAWKDALAAR
jgi:D-alanine-D-alanine ligase